MNAITTTVGEPTENVSADIMEAVRDAAMLADVTISTWGAEHTDKAAMEKVKADAGAVGNVGRVLKNTLAGADAQLKALKSEYHAVRQIHYQLTLPWISDPHASKATGPRLLPNAMFHRYLEAITKQKRLAESKLDAFIDEYPTLVARAKQNLGSLADADYPTADEVRQQFRIAFDFEPLPSGSLFRGLPAPVLDKLSRGLACKQHRMIDAANRAMWERVRGAVERLVTRLSAEEMRLHTSAVEHVRDLIDLLPGFNVVNDARAQEIVADIHAMLDGVSVDVLRKDDKTRADVTAKAQAVADKMSKWGL